MVNSASKDGGVGAVGGGEVLWTEKVICMMGFLAMWWREEDEWMLRGVGVMLRRVGDGV